VISDDDVTATASTPGGAAKRRGVPLAAIAAVLVVALAAAALAVVQTTAAGDAREERDAVTAAQDDERSARLVAAQFGETFFTYDHRDVEASTEALLGLVTDEYAQAFQEQRLPGVAELFASTELSTQGTAEDVFLSEIGEDQARAAVVLDVLATGQLETRTLDGLTLLLDLRRQAGEWRVDAVQLPQTRILGPDGQPIVDGDPAGDPTTTTTAPPG
jgi:hypothetical protein